MVNDWICKIKVRIRLREQHTNIIYPSNMEIILLSKMEGKWRKKEE